MILLVFLIIGISTIAAIARGRGASPWLWGLVALTGFFVVGALLARVVTSPFMALLANLGPFAWLALLALCLRFGLGRGGPQPQGKWSCPNCHWLNADYDILCGACKEPYKE